LGVADRLFFTGVVTRDDVAKVAMAFDIALQPDVTPYASPLKLFEYMAMGHAIVAPDLPNIREVLSHNEDAILFTPGDAKAFSEAVAALAQDANLRRRLGVQAMKNIEVNDRTWRANARRIAAMASEQTQGRDAKSTMIHRAKTEAA
jgi:glycosyltransferase involved in cell wall biosynthesis